MTFNAKEVEEWARRVPDLRDAHWVDLKVRRNGKFEYHQADYIKHLGKDLLIILDIARRLARAVNEHACAGMCSDCYKTMAEAREAGLLEREQ